MKGHWNEHILSTLHNVLYSNPQDRWQKLNGIYRIRALVALSYALPSNLPTNRGVEN